MRDFNGTPTKAKKTNTNTPVGRKITKNLRYQNIKWIISEYHAGDRFVIFIFINMEMHVAKWNKKAN